MKYMIGISIGPVQGFIAAARKTRDLWFGSYMLSEISRSVAADLLERKAELVFPPAGCVDSDSPIANKIFAIVDLEDTNGLDKEVRDSAYRKIDEFKEQALKSLSGIKINRDQLESQLMDFLEIYIAWFPYTDNYSDTRNKLEGLLAGRKAIKDFGPGFGQPGAPKSSLDGGLDSIVISVPKSNVKVKDGELLDGISLIKRLAEPRRFVSVSRIAADGFIRNLSRKCPGKLDELLYIATSLDGTDHVQPFDPASFTADFKAFPYDTRLFHMQENDVDIKESENAIEFVRKVKQIAKECRTGMPSPYFAVLVADGDHMGSLISGMTSIEEHIELSESLADFAKEAGEIVGKHNGAMVYSGGDDVLAFLPLDTALDCADSLNHAFRSKVGKGKGDVTLSCGLSIAHSGEHLQNLLDWGRKAERAAKDNGRDSLAVHLHTRTNGNEYAEVVHKWGDSPVSEDWANWCKIHEEELISEGYAYELRNLLREFEEIDNEDALIRETKRILDRKKSRRGKDAVTGNTIDLLCKSVESGPGKTADKIDRLVQGLIISKHIVTARKVAGVIGEGGSNV